jgi:heme oxygenase (biliverdin-IX-beta and delta-forming)
MSFDIFQRLKQETAVAHQSVENYVPVFRAGFDLQEYGVLLEKFYGFWAPLEAELSQSPSLCAPELDLVGRLKSHLLEDDLRFLGRDPAGVPRCDKLPAVDSFWRGLGCLYVLEGSTLGSRFISRRLEETLQVQAGSGASFFNAYGEAVGEHWKAFKAFATARVELDQAAEVVTSACDTFQNFEAWLKGGKFYK